MVNNCAKCRLCRRERKKLFLRGERCQTAKCAIVKRNVVPGMHGQKLANTRLTPYGLQLREKQMAKKVYGLRETQFSNYFEKASRKVGNTAQFFYELLEFRLDNVVRRSGFAKSGSHARQLVNHGHFLVNGKKVGIPSYQVIVGDLITLSAKGLKSKVFTDLSERMKNFQTPDWLFYDAKDNSLKVVDRPNLTKAALDYNLKTIIEFYSR